MKKTLRKKIILTTIALLFLSVCLPGLAADPGSNEDPLVTLSYINDVLMPQVKSYVDSKATASNDGFEIVNLKSGQTVIAGASTEMILRMGNAQIVATQKGGVADVTSGFDLQNGAVMPSNHLLIVPLDDGRGAQMLSDGIIMIKGNYTVK
ncbi:MAG: hypothetical protein J6R68_05760 [Clostridia bacterium]|nr:hypothetical protein [Clostridia bacterium]